MILGKDIQGQVREEHGALKLWQADNEDGTYTNPILYADYSDPDVIRVGDDSYMTHSSFNAAPGLPILHSKDLVNWEIVNYALERLVPLDHYNIPRHSKGVWAPSIRYHKGEYFIFWGDPDFGIFMVKAENPRGKWSEPLLILEGKGLIDPCPLWDGDEAYLVHAWAGSRAGINSILTIREMNEAGTKITSQGRNVFDGHDGHHTVEGPKLYKKDGYYWIFAPAGGVEQGWQLAMRSKNIYGPYEEKIVLEQGSTAINGPHQGGLVTAPNESFWFLHFQDQGVYGRVLMLQPVTWNDGWPKMGNDFDGNGIGEPVQTYRKPVKGFDARAPRINDDFKNGRPGLQWQWYANPSVKYSAQIPGTDYLRLFCISKGDEPNLWNVPNILLQKLPAPSFTATVQLSLTTEWNTPGKTAGLVMMGQSYSYIAISFHNDAYWIQQVIANDAVNGGEEKIIEEQKLTSNRAFLQMQVEELDAKCSFSYSENGKDYKKIGKVFFAERDLWISAKMGLFSTSNPDVRMGGYADFREFKVKRINK